MKRAAIVLLVLFAAVMVGCSDTPQPKPEIKHTGAVTVRAIDWYHQYVVLENDYGYMKNMHTCDPPLQFYIGQRIDDSEFYWVTWEMKEPGHDCDRILNVRRNANQ